jgi:hypothetical protein
MASTQTRDLFDQVQIGYVLIESEHLTSWKRFAQQGVGLHLEHESDTLLAFRMDGHRRRLIIRQGPTEDVVAVGLQLRDQSAVSEVLGRLKATLKKSSISAKIAL